MRKTRWFLIAAMAVAFLSGGGRALAEGKAKPSKELASFGILHAPAPEEARSQASAWLKGVGKSDATTTKAFDAIWASDRLLLDKVTETLALGDAQAAKLLNEARDPNAAAPTAVPTIINDAKRPAFYRANLALAYAKALSSRRVYEEGLDALKTVKVEQVVDPSSYLFHKAVAEHALMMRTEADQSILRLLDDVADAPERHKMVAALMHFDMQSWKDKDLGWIARKMNNIERRLDLTRGGPKTQKMQKEVVLRLDEIIKQLEKQCDCACNGGGCPNGGDGNGSKPSNNTQASSPQKDSAGGTGSGPGVVDPKKLKEMAENWGKLPERERAKAMVELTKDLPPRYREVIEAYFKNLAKGSK